MVLNNLTPWVDLLATVLTGAVGLVVLSFPPRSVARLSFGAGMLLLSMESALALFSVQASSPAVVAACQEGVLAVIAVASPVWLLFSLHYARGGRPRVGTGWRTAAALAFIAPLGAVVLPGPLVRESSVTASGLVTVLSLGGKAVYLHGVAIFTTVAALANLEQTFRAVTGTMRWRIKFLLLGLGIILLQRLVASGSAIVQEKWFQSNDLVHSALLVAGSIFIVWSLARMGLSEIAIYPSKKIIFTAATTTVVLCYCLVVGAVSWMVSRSMEEGTLAFLALIALAGWLSLGALLFSDRIRRRSMLFFSRHFSRPNYDYRTLWQTFTERVVPTQDENEYCRLGANFVSETLNALSVTVWQVGAQRKLSFGGSTLLTAESARQILSAEVLWDELIDALQDQDGVLDLDDAEGSWDDARGRLFANQFQETGGHRLCVPLRAGGELVGLLLVGDRVDAQPYTAEEMDLLHTLAGEISRGLLNLRQSRHLAAARELQAFQTMSAFVIHDLKNTVSTLSLTLQNFRQHFNNPAFREDALRAVSGCISHITDVITTLGGLRRELKAAPLKVDLNALVREALADLGGDHFLPVRCNFQETPPLLLDRAQIKKVLTNLLLNARDAVGANGSVEVSTALRNARQVELTVRDNGCGMSRDYLQTRLFKPFSSTKKNGLGIGLFQARKILEAHHGDIEVESTTGVGTVFRVLLPLNAQAR